jgi:hypothetical protein
VGNLPVQVLREDDTFDFVPILDVHTGFPFSRLDQNWNFIGAISVCLVANFGSRGIAPAIGSCKSVELSLVAFGRSFSLAGWT